MINFGFIYSKISGLGSKCLMVAGELVDSGRASLYVLAAIGLTSDRRRL